MYIYQCDILFLDNTQRQRKRRKHMTNHYQTFPLRCLAVYWSTFKTWETHVSWTRPFLLQCVAVRCRMLHTCTPCKQTQTRWYNLGSGHTHTHTNLAHSNKLADADKCSAHTYTHTYTHTPCAVLQTRWWRQSSGAAWHLGSPKRGTQLCTRTTAHSLWTATHQSANGSFAYNSPGKTTCCQAGICRWKDPRVPVCCKCLILCFSLSLHTHTHTNIHTQTYTHKHTHKCVHVYVLRMNIHKCIHRQRIYRQRIVFTSTTIADQTTETQLHTKPTTLLN